MVIVGLILLGLCFGSFVNALVWRLRQHELQGSRKKPNKELDARLSILKGRSMCPDCMHQLTGKDLIPVLSWLSLGGKCRYCKRPISAEYPIVELATAFGFVASYIWWPNDLTGLQVPLFLVWLAALTALMALLVYDVHWKLLPDRIMGFLAGIGVLYAAIALFATDNIAIAFLQTVLAVLIGGGIFYVLFQVSAGRWIGGGDVKLGWALGLFLATPARALLMLFLAGLLGTLVSLPLLATKRLERSSVIPFGPFLIVAAVIVQLFGYAILDWYQQTFLTLTP